ncbi:MAG: type IV toxin-antitoxin system AbiEi family antitoxin domain-containing protein [Deltaproteobacteria bacterium]|nr:type IV toxin-antitoxin system AbiEi family antitoxin domain-containing protein [Deltaproteobacteria bacterium]
MRKRVKPDWERLYEIAAAQDGYFSTRQAADAGYSRPLLCHHVRAGRLRNIRYGIYRLAQFPSGDHEDLVVVWLWSDRQGVFGYETALALHNLSDALPARVHLILPLAWKTRRFRFPRGVMAHYDDVPLSERTWFGAVPVTSPARTVNDCAAAHVSPELVGQAIRQGITRGLFDAETIAAAKSSSHAGNKKEKRD